MAIVTGSSAILKDISLLDSVDQYTVVLYHAAAQRSAHACTHVKQPLNLPVPLQGWLIGMPNVVPRVS